MQGRRLILSAATVAAMVPVLVGAASRIGMQSTSSPAGGRHSAGADRFLQLTGGGPGGSAGSRAASRSTAATQAAAAAPPAEPHQIPNGGPPGPARVPVTVPPFPL